jgi:arylformamidase
MFLTAGAHYIVPDFARVQDVGRSLMVLADQVRCAIAWVYNNAVHLGIDPKQLYVGGRSSGGHLAAVALTTHWPRDSACRRTKEDGMHDLTRSAIGTQQLCRVRRSESRRANPTSPIRPSIAQFSQGK